MNRAFVGLVVGSLCILAATRVFPAAPRAEKSAQPCVVISGADSRVTKPRYERITSQDEWARLWQEHKGEKNGAPYDFHYDLLTLPMIDFDQYMVLAVFQGESANNAGFQFDSMTEDVTHIVFKYVNKGYQTMGGQDNVAVYGFFVVRQSTKPIVLIEGTHLMDGTTGWVEKKTLPTPKTPDSNP
jgi:hypothetical protein